MTEELDHAGNPVCGQDFMAGTICSDRPGHGGGRSRRDPPKKKWLRCTEAWASHHPKHKTIHTWSKSGHTFVRELYEALEPWLASRRSTRFQEVLSA